VPQHAEFLVECDGAPGRGRLELGQQTRCEGK